MTQLLEMLEEWNNLMNETDKLNVIYLDFHKAFDTVPHKRLLLKLKAHGISQTIVNWVEKCLLGRKKRLVETVHPGTRSLVESLKAVSSVPPYF